MPLLSLELYNSTRINFPMKKKVSEKSRKAKKRIIIESFVVFLIIASPFVFKLHEYFSSDPEATIKILGISIDRNGFANLSVYAWFMLGKIVPLYLLFIWFLTCRHWWYHSILIPITMYAFQIFEVIFSDNKYIDTENLLWLLPVCMVVIPIVYFIRIKLYDKHVHGIDLEAMEAELQILKTRHQFKNSEPMPLVQNDETEEEDINLSELSFSEKINYLLSTRNLESYFRNFQHTLQNWVNLRF